MQYSQNQLMAGAIGITERRLIRRIIGCPGTNNMRLLTWHIRVISEAASKN